MNALQEGLKNAVDTLKANGHGREIYRKTKDGWASAKLHDIGPRMKHGIDERRIRGLAAFIDGLDFIAPMRRTTPAEKNWAPGPVKNIEQVYGQNDCAGYMCQSGGQGMGVECYIEGARKYYLTGYGITCWAWGQTNGMAALAEGGFQEDLYKVLSALPIARQSVQDLDAKDLRPQHVAAALLYYVSHHEDDDVVNDAWVHASKVVAPWEAPKAKPIAKDTPLVAGPAAPNGKVASLTQVESWKRLVMMDDYEGMSHMASLEVAKLQSQIDKLMEQRDTWKKRRTMAQSLMEEVE